MPVYLIQVGKYNTLRRFSLSVQYLAEYIALTRPTNHPTAQKTGIAISYDPYPAPPSTAVSDYNTIFTLISSCSLSYISDTFVASPPPGNMYQLLRNQQIRHPTDQLEIIHPPHSQAPPNWSTVMGKMGSISTGVQNSWQNCGGDGPLNI